MKKCEIYYFRFPNCQNKLEKLSLVDNARFKKLDFERIFPDKNNNWIDQTDNDFDSLLPVCDKQVKLGKNQQAIFKLFSLGVVSARDEWVYDFSKYNLIEKVKLFIEVYNSEATRWQSSDRNQTSNDFVNRKIKWTSELEDYLKKNKNLTFSELNITNSLYRPYIKNKNYFDKVIIHRLYQLPSIFGEHNQFKNKCIIFTDSGSQKPFLVNITNTVFDYHFVGSAAASLGISLYVYDKDGNRHDNITDWALNEFRNHYQKSPLPPFNEGGIFKLDIFHYVYAVLHNPAYREKYELNLKREFPRIPYYENFELWAEWGKQLMDLHLNYETIAPFPLERHDLNPPESPFPKEGFRGIPKAKLKADKQNGMIQLDEMTTLSEIPTSAWEYKLGNRSALEWILDQYKEKKPKDPTIAEKFNTYKFADYKEQVIDLLRRVCTVSVETMKIIEAMG